MRTKNDICNLALSRLGDKGTVENIDNPSKQTEKIFAKWYDISRRSALRRMMPSFARTRGLWAKSSYEPAFGYEYAYAYKTDCLRVLGIGDLDEKENNYAVEGGYILTNEEYSGGLPVRYVEDVKDFSKYTDSFIELFTLILAYNVAPEITESTTKVQIIQQNLQNAIMETIGIDSQENKPIVIKHSKLLSARLGQKYTTTKK
jgi:hypothetical protein